MLGHLDFGCRSQVQFTRMELPSPRSKRSNAEVDECDECLPISKRINRLRIEAQRKGQGEETLNPSQQVNGHAVGGVPQPSTYWQSDVSQHSDTSGSHGHGPGGFGNGHGFSPPNYSVTSPSASCSVCGVLPQGVLCPHLSPDGQLTLNLHNSANISTRPQYSAHISPIMTHQFLQDSASDLGSQHQFQQFGSQGSDVRLYSQGTDAGLYPQYGSNVSQFGSGAAGLVMEEEYDPELGETENPYYFHINEVLFNAHHQRLRRTTTPQNPDAGS